MYSGNCRLCGKIPFDPWQFDPRYDAYGNYRVPTRKYRIGFCSECNSELNKQGDIIVHELDIYPKPERAEVTEAVEQAKQILKELEA
jgi:hypothetical protein